MKRCLGVMALFVAGVLAWVALGRRRPGAAGSPVSGLTAVPVVAAEPAIAAEPVVMAEPAAAAEPLAAAEPPAVPEPALAAQPVAAAGEPFGPGSAAPLPDGSAPEGFTIKGNADSMLFHTADSPYYKRTRAEAWFSDEESAQTAGFSHWDRKRRP